jgi:hypothetical protein
MGNEGDQQNDKSNNDVKDNNDIQAYCWNKVIEGHSWNSAAQSNCCIDVMKDAGMNGP